MRKYETGKTYEIKLKANRGTYKVISIQDEEVYFEGLTGTLTEDKVSSFSLGSDFDHYSKLVK